MQRWALLTVKTLAALVRIPSVVGNEGEAQAFMRDAYLDAGLDVDVFEADRDALSKLPAFVDSGISFSGRPNVVGMWAGAGGGRSLILNGHTDIVSPEPVSAWRSAGNARGATASTSTRRPLAMRNDRRSPVRVGGRSAGGYAAMCSRATAPRSWS